MKFLCLPTIRKRQINRLQIAKEQDEIIGCSSERCQELLVSAGMMGWFPARVGIPASGLSACRGHSEMGRSCSLTPYPRPSSSVQTVALPPHRQHG